MFDIVRPRENFSRNQIQTNEKELDEPSSISISDALIRDRTRLVLQL